MSTVVKALSLLEHFDSRKPEFGLVDMARVSGFDKATTRRLLVSLAEKGFIEQDPDTRRYRLGAALLRLARLRETKFPLIETACPIIGALSAASGETVHVSEVAAGVLSSVLVAESRHAHRVSVDVGQKLPFNCTASGLAFLSSAPEVLLGAVLKGPLPKATSKSIVSPGALRSQVEATRERGYAFNDQGLEEGVVSVAAPILGASGSPIGAISIATPAERADATAVRRHGAEVRDAARRLSAALGGRVGPN